MSTFVINQTLFDRMARTLHSPLALAGIGVLFICASLGAVILDGQAAQLGSFDLWRIALLPPAVTIYILAIAPALDRMGPEVINALRPIVQIDDESFARLVFDSSRISRRNEVLSIFAGALIGAWMVNGSADFSGFSWSRLYWTLANGVLMALLVWIIYVSLAATRLIEALHRQPLKVDLFDLTPFIPMGRQSLLLALVFVGGILISLLLGVQPESLRSPVFWVTYLLMAMVPVLVFFMNMRPTHKVLSREKKVRQEKLEDEFRQAFHRLETKMGAGEEPAIDSNLAQELGSLAIYERHLLAAPTWPYHTSQLRTLVITVLIPIATLIARVLVSRVFEIEL